ncbi:MAG: hypothetical protein IPK17_32440 [Chloroflexi bacterium]|uniref:hypothetical protein n=1 Tax=Candidatus Flexifilum breve TaxID=3140694 RepID=UPI0031375BA4|nr:hypothetical protein [Chloroflexota bacterium]
MKQRIGLLLLFSLLLLLPAQTPLTAQQVILLDPTGVFPIGLTSRYWIDENRFDFETFTQESDLQPGYGAHRDRYVTKSRTNAAFGGGDNGGNRSTCGNHSP